MGEVRIELLYLEGLEVRDGELYYSVLLFLL